MRKIKISSTSPSKLGTGGQSALEYLVTYGWAMLAILGFVGILYVSGILDFSSILPQRCDFFGQVICNNFFIDGPAQSIQLEVVNDLGADLALEGFAVYYQNQLSCENPNIRQNWNRSQLLLISTSGCTGLSDLTGSRIGATLNITFFRNHSWCLSGPVLEDSCKFYSLGRIQAYVNS